MEGSINIPEVKTATWDGKSTVSVSSTGTATDEVDYITIDGVEKKIKETAYTAGQNITITNNVISATDTTYTAGDGISIEQNVITAKVDGEYIDYAPNGDLTIDTQNVQIKLVAGDNIQINNEIISATDTTYTGSDSITVNSDNAISVNVDDDTIKDTQLGVAVNTNVIQEKLTAGSNIQINNNTISATDTTYVAGDGIDIEQNVISTKIDDATLVYTDDGELKVNIDNETIKYYDVYGAHKVAVDTEIMATIQYVDGGLEQKSEVSGTNDGTNWTSITIDGERHNIPSAPALYQHNICIYTNPQTTVNINFAFINNKATQYKTADMTILLQDINKIISNPGIHKCMLANGSVNWDLDTSGTAYWYNIVGITATTSGSNFQLLYNNDSNGNITETKLSNYKFTTSNNLNVYDTVYSLFPVSLMSLSLDDDSEETSDEQLERE